MLLDELKERVNKNKECLLGNDKSIGGKEELKSLAIFEENCRKELSGLEAKLQSPDVLADQKLAS